MTVKYKENWNNLESLIKKMDIPLFRKTIKSNDGVRWLSRNLQINNAEHPKFDEARTVIRQILKNRC